MKYPICGSEMELKSSEFKVKIGYGTASSKIHINVCPDCGYDIDEKSNKKIIAETINRSNYECAYKILEFLKASGKNFSEIERKFNLPSRTLSKWVNKKNKTKCFCYNTPKNNTSASLDGKSCRLAV